MEGLEPVRRLLEESAAHERVRAFWWRDDDAVVPGARLASLFDRAADVGARVAIAAIPSAATPDLLRACEDAGAAVWQHGVAHINHQKSGKSAELGDAREPREIVDACVAVRERLHCAAFHPVMVPPWNRMRDDLGFALAFAGYTGVSRFGGPRKAGPMLTELDTHIDPVCWRGARSLISPEALAAQVERAAAQDGPIGLLTHHAVHDEAIDAFVAAFARLVRDHPAAAWVSPSQALGRVGAEA